MKYLIAFEIVVAAICAFVAWYVQSPSTNDTLTIGLIIVLVSMACVLGLIWIVLVILFVKYLMLDFWCDSSMTEQT